MAHSLWGSCRPFSPGLINHQAMLSVMATAVWSMGFSCYFGRLLGSYIPGALYSGFGWFACYLCIQLVRLPRFSFCSDCRTAPDLR
ncbi:MAG: hypothetical protein ACLRWP_12415 [Bilophila wadsworthia]